MVQLKFGPRTVDLTQMMRIYGVTEKAFERWVDEDTKAELLDGVMIVHSPATMLHDFVAQLVRNLMNGYAQERRLGVVFGPDSLIRMAPRRRFGPDAYYLPNARVPRPLPAVFIGVPDLIVEVLSPSNRSYDLGDKRRAYHQAGVREIWFVDPDRRQVVIDRRKGRVYDTETQHEGKAVSAVLIGFWLEVSWLWAERLPNALTCLRKILKSPSSAPEPS